MKIPFSPPYIDDTVINEVVDSLRSGWITSGPKVKALEEEIKSFSGAIERIAREKYLMKKPNEDIYVFEEDIEE